MHDVVTHRVSLMVLQAGALRITAADEPTRQAAEELRAAGCQALDELRDLVGILRTEPDGDEAPSASDFAALVAESTAVGNPAELVEVGNPALASPVVGRTAYRIMREALTNVRKHAPGARVRVRVELRRGPGAALDPQHAAGQPARRPGRHRLRPGPGPPAAAHRAVHGTLRAGPEPDGGFCVEATLPAYVPTAEPAA